MKKLLLDLFMNILGQRGITIYVILWAHSHVFASVCSGNHNTLSDPPYDGYHQRLIDPIDK